MMWREKAAKYGVRFSQIDAAFPLSLPEGASLGVEYVLRTIRWAYLAGCDHIDTTDDRFAPKGLTHDQAMEMMKRSYAQIIEVAERYKMIIDIEPHGYYTTKPEFMEKMLAFVDSPYLRMNMDTGNTFIAGQDPVAFLQEVQEQGQPRAYQGCQRIAGGLLARRADRHRRQPVRHRRRCERGKHQEMLRYPGGYQI